MLLATPASELATKRRGSRPWRFAAARQSGEKPRRRAALNRTEGCAVDDRGAYDDLDAALAPFLGRTRQPNMFVAAGHYRNGILLTPITARIIADLMLGERTHALADAFAPNRKLPAQA